MQIGVDYIGITTPFYCNDGKGNFVFHKRSQNCRDEQGMWDPGSGKLDFGTDLEANVLREVLEEYGCAGKIQEQLPALDIFRNFNDKTTHWLCVASFVLVEPSQVKNNEPKKIDEIGWFRLNNLPQPLSQAFQITFEKFPKHFAKYM